MNKGIFIANRVLVLFLLLAITQPLCGQDTNQKLATNLAQHLEKMDPAEMVEVLVEMTEQVTDLEMGAARVLPTKKQRRVAVISALKNRASHTQGDVLNFLNQQQRNQQVANIKPLWIHNLVAVRATRATVNELANRKDVGFIFKEAVAGEELFPVQPRPVEPKIQKPVSGRGTVIECGVDVMGAPAAWDLGFLGEGVVVAVIDTGVCFQHRDMQGREWINVDEIPGNDIDDDQNGHVDDISGWNFRDNNSDFSDDNSHGTHCAGTVAGTGADGVQTGMAPRASVMALKFWNDFGGESVAMQCLEYAVDNDADVISASWGWPLGFETDHALWRTVMINTMATGIVTVFAAGNERGNTSPPLAVRTPGDVPDVITVGATDCADRLADFSSPGPVTWGDVAPWFDWRLPDGLIKPEIAAPGVATNSTFLCAGYQEKSGTSMATPHVAGAAALILSKNPLLDHFEVKQIMADAAIDLGDVGKDNDFGEGRLSAIRAIELTPDPTVTVAADTHHVLEGVGRRGTTSDLEFSDNEDLAVTRSTTSIQSIVDVELVGSSSILSPSTIDFTLESSVFARGTIVQSIRMFNYDTGAYEEIDSRNASRFIDSTVTVTIDTEAARFVDSVTGKLTVRVLYKGGTARDSFTANMDFVSWLISP